jgi:hypothetical protein
MMLLAQRSPTFAIQHPQRFSILQRKRPHQAAVADLAALAERLMQFIAGWKAVAHPFRWTPQSFAKILAQAEAVLAEAV